MRTICLSCAFVVATSLSFAAMASAPNGADRAADLRDKRYCEILLGYSYAAQINLMVFNTIGFSYCPKDKMAALNTKALAAENAADVALLNGARFWVMDAIDSATSAAGETKNFGGIEMIRLASLKKPFSALKSGVTSTPYTTNEISRTTTFTYDRGKAIFELIDPSGKIYVMQSYSQQVDPTLKMSDLPRLGDRRRQPHLNLPSGWTYKTEVLQQDLEVSSSGVATIVQDDLDNTYQMR